MTDMASNHGKITRVFPRRTAATPEDPYAFTGPPPCGELPDISEVHISVTFTYDMQKAERLADMWSATGLPVRMGGPAFCEPGGAFVPGRYLKYGYVITSRGCPNRCWFCSVPKREGGVLRELPITSGWNVLDELPVISEDMVEQYKEEAEYEIASELKEEAMNEEQLTLDI